MFSCCLKDTVLVEKFLVRESDGLLRIDFLRLSCISSGIAEHQQREILTQQQTRDATLRALRPGIEV